MELELGELESSSADTSLEAHEQQYISNWRMERTTVDDCSLVDGSSNSGEITSSLEEFVNGTQTDSQTSTSFASSKIIFLQMSRKPEDKELVNEENKQFDSGRGTLGLNDRLLSFDLFVCLFRFVFAFHCWKNQVMIILLRPKENMGGDKRTNGGANPVDEELYRWERNFLLFNHLKTTSRYRFSRDALGTEHGAIPSLFLVCLVFCSC